MANRSAYGNLTAALVVIALFESVIDRLLARLFLSPDCRSGLGCVLLQTGPFFFHLTGLMALVVAAGSIAGHLRRGELFPRGVRLTIAGLSAVFLSLLLLSLVFGRMPDRYHVHLETSFAFVVALLALSFVGARASSPRTRAGFLLFALPMVLHVAGVVAARAGWLPGGAITPRRLTLAGELTLLVAASAAPLLLVPRGGPRARIVAGLALAAGVAAFFFVAFVARTDLVQTVALYWVHLDLPKPLSLLGVLYVLALFGLVTTTAVLLLSPGPSRLAGLGLCLVALAGYQTASPVELAVSLCGLIALATGVLRAAGHGGYRARLTTGAWRTLLSVIASGISDSAATTTHTPHAETIEVSTVVDAGTDTEIDRGIVRARRRGHPVACELRRVQSIIRRLDVTVGSPGESPPDATIESHEAWLVRRPEDRSPLPRVKTGDPTFDRKLRVHGEAPIQDRAFRRRILRLADGTITIWGGQGVRFVAPGNPVEALSRFGMPAAASTERAIVELVDTLIDLVETSHGPTSSTSPTTVA